MSAGTTHRAALAPGYRIAWYEVQRVLGQGGFGITYLALDTNLEQPVAIKEYLPVELAVRDDDRTVQPMSGKHGEQFDWGLTRFIEEARTLARFKHQNIVRVLSVFEANNTAYMVMEYEHGDSLQARLANRATLDETELLSIVAPLLDGLEQVHVAGFIHRDIKPDNIFLREDGSPVLIDFGSARQATGGQTKTLTALVSPGYAPFEQYYSKSDDQGPWTDIYGLAATMYRAICGRAPMDAVDRSRTVLESNTDRLVSAAEIGAGTYSERLLAAIDHGLAFRSVDRPPDIASWKRDFDIESPGARAPAGEPLADAPTVRANPTAPAMPPPAAPATRGGPGRVGAWLAAAALIALAAAIALSGRFGGDPAAPSPATRAMAPTQTAPESPPAATPATDPPPASAAVHPHAARVAEWLRLAGEQRRAGKVLSPPSDNALASLREALALDPDDAAALEAVGSIFTGLLDDADRAIRAGELDAAQVALDYAATVDAGDPDLARVNIALRDARRRQAVARQQEAEREAVAAKARAEAGARAQAESKARAEAQQRTLAAAEKQRAEERARAEVQARELDREQAAADEQRAAQERVRLAGIERDRQRAAVAAERNAELEQCRAEKAVALAEPKRALGDTLYFAALAVGRDNGWGEAAGYTSQAEAEASALKNCAGHGEGCAIKAWSNDCVALARGAGDAAGWSWGTSVADAATKAVDLCEAHSACCSVASAYCADEVR